MFQVRLFKVRYRCEKWSSTLTKLFVLCSVRVTCPSLLSIGGLITTMLFGFWCQSFAFEGKNYDFTVGEENVKIDVRDLHFSPWYRQRTTLQDIFLELDGLTVTVTTRDECVTWGEDEDSKWIFVRAITVITPIIGGIFAVMLCMMQVCPPCTPIVRKSWNCMGLTFILVLTLFQGLAFLIFRSNACEENPFVRHLTKIIEGTLEDRGVSTSQEPAFDFRSGILWENECSWDKGSSANVAAVVFWFLAGAVMLALGAPASPDESDESPAQEKDKDEEENAEDDKDAEDKAEQPEQAVASDSAGETHEAEEEADNDADIVVNA